MDIILFTNFFPYKRSEPFLVNEIGYTKKFAGSISVLTLYGTGNEASNADGLILYPPLLPSPASKSLLFFRGILNFAPFGFHSREFFLKKLILCPSKAYWFFVSLLITRMAMSSRSFAELLRNVSGLEDPVLYFYWSDNLCWLAPYLRHSLSSRKIKIVIRFHGSDLYENLKADYAPLRKMIFRSADLLCPVSENGAGYLRRKYPEFSAKIHVSRLGVDDHGLNPLPAYSTHIVSVSNLVPLKRVHLIYEALQLMSDEITWHHFGDGPLARNLASLVKPAREGLHIKLHGHVDNAALMVFYRTQPVNLFINVSITEGLPVSIMEALSFGIPVLATNVGGVGELVNDSDGMLVPENVDAIALSKNIKQLISGDVVPVTELRENARKIYEEKVMAEKNYNEFYNRLLRL
jgi:glycosyltransferase involved in cell wall biosynthesis